MNIAVWNNRRALWLSLLAIAVPAALFVSYRAWSWSCERRLAAVVDGLRREGQPVTAADLDRGPAVPEAEDAAADLRAAAAMIDTGADAWRSYRSATYTDPLNGPAKRALRAVLEQESGRKALERIRAARGKSRASWHPPMQSPLSLSKLPELDKLWAVSDLCRAAALDAHLRGDDAAAAEFLRDLLGVGRAAGRHPMMWGHFTATGAYSTAADVVARDVAGMRLGAAPPDAPGGKFAAPQPVRALVDDLLDDVQPRESFLRGLRDERVAQLDMIHAIADESLTIKGLADAYGIDAGDVPLVPRPTVLADGRAVVEYTNALLKAAETCADLRSFGAAAGLPPAPPWAAVARGGARAAPPRGAPLRRLLLLPIEQAPTVHFRCEAERRLAAAALAVRWFQAEHGGSPPRALTELAPKYLPAVPVDPFANKGTPVRYVADGQRLIVYSVGENGADDGGSTRATNPNRYAPGSQPPGRWDQLDAVFDLTPRPPEETRRE